MLHDIEFVENAYELKGREQQEAAAMMLGRASYQAFSPIWPEMAEFADYNAMPKYVVSTRLKEDELVENWGDTIILRWSTTSFGEPFASETRFPTVVFPTADTRGDTFEEGPCLPYGCRRCHRIVAFRDNDPRCAVSRKSAKAQLPARLGDACSECGISQRHDG